MRIARLVALGALAFFLLLCTGTTAAWAVDEHRHKGQVSRNVELAGRDISAMSRNELGRTVDELAERYKTTRLIVGLERTFEVPAEQTELELNKTATIDAAMSTGRTGNPIARVADWVASLSDSRQVDAQVTFDDAALKKAVVANDPGPRTEPAEPAIEVQEDRFVPVPGKEGEAIDPAAVASQVEDAARDGLPLRIEVAPVKTRPKFADADAAKLAQQAETSVVLPLPVTVDGRGQSIDSKSIRRWVRTAATETGLVLQVDEDGVRKDLQRRFARAGQEVVEPVWRIEDGRPVATPGRSGTACCEEAGLERVQDALEGRIAGRPSAQPPDLPLKVIEPEVTEDEIPELRITEPVATFTTNHSPNGPRVTNIHRIADLTRGAVIEPGKTFSLNDAVGRRTEANGFVVDKVIDEGRYAEAVGGGISQYATTLFNAAFFGGLDFGEYQSHSIYINRYPYGREATVSFPHPDLQIRNTTPHGILLWPTYTDSSITVTLYSTLYAAGEQTGQSESRAGECTKVTTERSRRYIDGRSSRDSVIAIYQPEEGVRC